MPGGAQTQVAIASKSGTSPSVTPHGYVILSGPPASGKSTLGPPLADQLDWPYLAKDVIKQALIEKLGAPDVERSRRLGAAAMTALVAVAAGAGCGVLDGSWLRDRSKAMVQQLPAPVVEVFCRCPQVILEERYATRAGRRTAGHFDRERCSDELWGEQTAEPVAGGWSVIEVATNNKVDIVSLAHQVRSALGARASQKAQHRLPALPL